jgi:GTPase SAR1 family protein
VLNELGTRRADGTECEAILWDLAGQPDYRLTHALFLDDADLALVLFDPTDSRDPLHGVEFWLKQLKAGQTSRTSGQQTQSATSRPPVRRF